MYHRFETPLTLGVLGGGQLGRMMLPALHQYDLHVRVMDDHGAPMQAHTPGFCVGDITHYEDVLAFGQECDLVTIEIEKINLKALHALQEMGKLVRPGLKVLEIAQDKGLQKQFFSGHGYPTSPFIWIDAPSRIGVDQLPGVQKLRRGGYDGRGVKMLKTMADVDEAFSGPSILEELVPVQKELSIVVARNGHGDVVTYPLVEMVFNPERNLLDYLLAPAQIRPDIAEDADALARQMADDLELEGLVAIELFLDTQDRILVNEIAPRLHNSGHHTIEAAVTSQFEQHVRAILNLPLGGTRLHQAAAMANLLGHPEKSGTPRYSGFPEALALEDVHIHLYGKPESRPGRKMGHLTAMGSSVDEARRKILEARKAFKIEIDEP